MRSLLLIALALLISNQSIAQQPMPLDYILSKVDSIQAEANQIYSHLKSSQTTLKAAKLEGLGDFDESHRLEYEREDTIVALLLNQSNEVVYEAKFLYDFTEPIQSLKDIRNLTENETKILKIKQKLLEESKKNKYNISTPEACYLSYTLLPFNNGYKFYILTLTEQENLIPFGNDFLFIADQKGEVISNRTFYYEFLPWTPDESIVIILQYPVFHPFIFATDICTFRMQENIGGVDLLSVYSRRNKRYFNYNKEKNELKVERNF